MDSITAPFTERAITRLDDKSNRVCPVCGDVFTEDDIDATFLQDADLKVELCDRCIADYQHEAGDSLESDVVDAKQFEQLHNWASDNLALPDNEFEAKQAARYLGAECWQSGGGIYLMLIDRDDGTVCCVSSDCITVHRSRDAMEAGETALEAISFLV